MENLFNVNQAAFILKVHPLTIRRYIKEQKLKAVKAGGNVRIPENELAAFTKTFTPRPKEESGKRKKVTASAKPFIQDDPFLRLEGRGASLSVESLGK